MNKNKKRLLFVERETGLVVEGAFFNDNEMIIRSATKGMEKYITKIPSLCLYDLYDDFLGDLNADEPITVSNRL